MEDKKHVYLTMHEKFVREDISYIDQRTGDEKTFNSVTLPKNTVVDGVDVGYYQFSPLFVNPSRFKGEHFRDIPLLADREVWLTRTQLDENGDPVKDEGGKDVKDTVKVMPAALKEAVDKGRKEFLASLDDKAKDAREASRNQDRSERAAEPVAR